VASLGSTLNETAAQLDVDAKKLGLEAAELRGARPDVLAQMKDDLLRAKQTLATASNVTARTKAASDLARATDKFAGSALAFAASEKDADATAAGHRAKLHERGVESARQELDDAQKLVDRALEFYRQWEENKVAAERASLGRA
jgi:hypothetical protein